MGTLTLQDRCLNAIDAIGPFGIKEWAARAQYSRGKDPQIIYRGLKSTLAFLPDELEEKVQGPAFVEDLKQNLGELWRATTKVSPLSYDEALLIQHLQLVAKRLLEEANFNGFPVQGKRWGEGSRIDHAKDNTWASDLIQWLNQFGFLLKMPCPEGQHFWWDDGIIGEDFGIETDIAPELLLASKRDDLLYRVKFQGNWYRPDRIREIWEPPVEFTQSCINHLLLEASGQRVEEVRDWIREKYTTLKLT